MICPRCKYEWKDPNRVKGGKLSRRKLTPAQARKMVQAREARRKKKL